MKFLLSLLLIFITTQAQAVDYCADANTKLCVKFEESGAATVDDSSASANDGTVTSVTQGSTTKKYGTYAVQFSNTNNAKIDFGSAASLDNITAITICGWFNNTSYGTAATGSDKAALVSKGYRSGDLEFKTTNQLRWVEHTGNGTATWDTSNGSVTTGTYQHYCIAYDRTTGSTLNAGPSIYINGTAQTVSNTGASTVGGTRDDDSANNFLLGLDDQNIGELDSYVDELIVYSGVLNSTQVNDIMNCGLDGTNCGGGGGVKKLMTIGDGD